MQSHPCLVTGYIPLVDAVKRYHMHLTNGESVHRRLHLQCGVVRMQISTAAVYAAEEQREVASKEAHRQALFPSLSSCSTPAKPAHPNPTG